MGIFRKDDKNKNLIVLDIGTQFVKALLVEIDKKENRGIIYAWVKEPIYPEKEKPILESNKTFVACEKALKNLDKKHSIKTDEVFLGIGNDVIKGKSTILHYKRENPQEKIDLTELKYLAQKIQWHALDEARKELASETDFQETDARLIDAWIIDIKIDGKSIPDPIGFQGNILSLTVFNTYAPIEYLEKLNNLFSALKLKLIGVCPISYALFHALDLEKSQNGDALIINIGGKTTEVTLIKNGGESVETKEFHLGGWIFSKILAEYLGVNIDDAEIIKMKFCRGEVGVATKKRLEKLFNPPICSWLNGIKIIAADFYIKHKSLPSRVFLCGGGSNMALIEESLKNTKSFKINYILPRDILNIENKTKFQETSGLALAALFLDMPSDKNNFYSLLKRATRLTQN